MKVNLVAAVCCMVVCMATICAGSVPIVQCDCLKHSTTQVQVTKLRSYTVQNARLCVISAIRFETQLGKVICSAPNLNWTKNAVKYLDAKAKPAKPTPIPVTTPRNGGPSPTPIPVTTPRKGGPSPTNPTTKSPVQDRGSTLTLESAPSKPTPNFPGQGSTPTSFIPSSVEKRDTTSSNPTTKSPVQDRGSTSSPPTTPTTMTTHQETQTTRRPVHRDTSPPITRKPINHNTKQYTPLPITRKPINHNTKRYTSTVITRKPINHNTKGYTSIVITRKPINHNTKRYTSTVITRKPINHNTKGYTSIVITRKPINHNTKRYISTVITRKPINHNTKGNTSTVIKIITVLPTRKLPSWIKRRQNRWKKPGLRRKQRVNYLRPHK